MSETALPSGDVWCWLISAAMAMADYDGHSPTTATSGVTALPLGGVVLVDLDDQSVLRELSRPLERRGLPVQRSRRGPSRARTAVHKDGPANPIHCISKDQEPRW